MTPELAVEYVERLDPQQPARPPDAGQPAGQQQGARPVAADHREGAGDRSPGHLAVRPDARQHPRVVHRLQDPPLRPHRRRGAGLLRGAPRARHPSRRHARRDHRRERHRMPRRRAGHLRLRPRGPVRDRVRSAAEHPAVASSWPSSSPRCFATRYKPGQVAADRPRRRGERAGEDEHGNHPEEQRALGSLPGPVELVHVDARELSLRRHETRSAIRRSASHRDRG